MRRAFFALFTAAVVAAAFIYSSASPERAVGAQDKPNVIVIMTDDQAMTAHGPKIMPKTYKWVGPQNNGTIFEKGYAVPPLCCPSRAGFLTGQYPHNHGVWVNDYALMIDKQETLPVWLDRAGYETALVGKYLNKYERAVTGGEQISNHIPTPPGYDYVYQALERKYRNYYVSDNGARKWHGDAAKEYLTNVLNQKAVAFIDRQAKDPQRPFFLYLAHFAPHSAKNVKVPACNGRGAPESLPSDWRQWKDTAGGITSANFNEADVSDKPRSERYPKMTGKEIQQARQRLRCARAAMAPVDRGVDEIHKALKRHGMLDDTIVVFVSDNGYFYGEHRIRQGKNRPYTEAMIVPFMMRVPARFLGGVTPKARVDQPVGIFDLAPTIMDLAGLKGREGRLFDGISIAPALKGQALERKWILLEQRSPCQRYSSILEVETNMIYSVWHDRHPVGGECPVIGRELYDLNRDSEQLNNLWATASGPTLKDLRKALANNAKKRLRQQLKRCAAKPTKAARKRCRKAARRKYGRTQAGYKSSHQNDEATVRAYVQRLEEVRRRLADCKGQACRTDG